MNAANLLTLFRAAVTPLILWLLWEPHALSLPASALLVLVSTLYVLGAVSDWLDGHLSRRTGTVTRLGEFMDPLADKIFTLGLFFGFLALPVLYFPAWARLAVWLIAAREILVTILRLRALALRRTLRTERHGKWKTGIQITAQSHIFAVLLAYAVLHDLGLLPTHAGGWQHLPASAVMTLADVPRWITGLCRYVPSVAVFCAATITLYSGWAYLRASRS